MNRDRINSIGTPEEKAALVEADGRIEAAKHIEAGLKALAEAIKEKS